MKKIIISLFFTLICVCASAQYYNSLIECSLYKTNYWTNWLEGSGVSFYGGWSQITAYDPLTGNLSAFYFRVTVNNFAIPDKKTRKEHVKTNTWYEYTGTMEYWIDDEHMTFESTCNRNFPISANPSVKFNDTPSIIKKSTAKIKIAPYEKYPQTYNIWFDNIGFAFNMCGQHF